MKKKYFIAIGMSLAAAVFGFQSDAQSEEDGFNIITSKNTKIKFYGFIRLDGVYDDSRPSNKKVPVFINSEDEGASAGTKKNEDSFTFHTKLTRFGFALDGPTIKEMNDAKVTGKLELDFYGTAAAESRNHLRMRKAYVNFAWDNFDLLTGQTSDLISPLYPAVNPDMVMWGAGNLGDRRPQIRGTYTVNDNIVLQAMAGTTGAIDNTDIDAGGTIGNGVNDGDAGSHPTFQARASFKNDKIEFGVWGYEAKEDPGTAIALHGADDFRSHAVGYDFMMKLGDTTIKSEAWIGANLDDVRGGMNQGLNTAHVTGSGTTTKEIDARGGWVEVTQKLTDTYSLSVGHTQDNPDNKDLNTGSRKHNKVSYLANRWNYGDIQLGLDYLYWKTEFKGQGGGLDNRVNFFVAYNF